MFVWVFYLNHLLNIIFYWSLYLKWFICIRGSWLLAGP